MESQIPVNEINDVWIKNVQKIIYSNLIKIISKERIVKYLEQRAMDIWIKAFVHKSYNINYNYETLEFLGDHVLKLVFPRYLLKKFTILDEAAFTELEHSYMSKNDQANLAKSMHLDTIIVTVDRLNFHIIEDTFESFFGALFEVSDLVEIEGMGYINSFNMIKFLFDKIKIDLTKALGHVKTRVIQYFQRFGLGSPKEIYVQEEATNKMTIQLTQQMINFLAEYNINVPNNGIIGVGTGPNKGAASNNAYQNAIDNLTKLGVTLEWVERTKLNLDLNQEGIKQLVGPALEKLRKLGYVSLRFDIPSGSVSKKNIKIELRGVDKNGKEDILVTQNVEKGGEFKAKITLLEYVINQM